MTLPSSTQNIKKTQELSHRQYNNKSNNKEQKTNEWIIKANFNLYDHESSFQKNGYIDWKQGMRPRIGDIVYVYITKPVQRIKFRTQVDAVDLDYADVTDDEEFWKDKKKYYSAKTGKYMRLSVINKVNKEELSYTQLLRHGLPDLKPPFYKITNGQLLDYINKMFGIDKEDLSVENPRNIPQEIKSYVWNRDRGRCVICGSNENIHYDHIIPYSKGGTSLNPDNIRILCQKCNLSKGNKIQ